MALSFRIALVGCVVVAGAAGADDASILAALHRALASIDGDRLLNHVKALASDEFEGRAPGTPGERLTLDYIARELRSAGLEPGVAAGAYFQDVPLVGFRAIPRLAVTAGGKEVELAYPAEFVPATVRLEPKVRVAASGVVFAGYGIVAPQYDWDDYGDADVTEKLVIVLSGEPASPDPSFFRGGMRTYHSTMEDKYETARRHGAAGVLVVSDPEKSGTFSIFSTFAELGARSLPSPLGERTLAIAGLLTVEAMERLCEAAGVTSAELEQAAGTPGFRARALGSAARIEIDSEIRSFTSANVVARVPGSDPAWSDEAVVFTAHWDHLGRNPALAGDQIYNGANDNAAGVAQLLELARGFAALEVRPRRSIFFIATTGEESGFLGAKHYVANPLVPLDRTVAAFNLDAGNLFGVTRDLASAGYGNSTLDEVLARAARMQGRNFVTESLDGDGRYYFASDQVAFARAGVPAAFPWSGSEYVGKPPGFGDQAWGDYGEHRYHQVSDGLMPNWDMAGAVEDVRWLLIAAYLVAQEPTRPAWKAGAEFQRPSP